MTKIWDSEDRTPYTPRAYVQGASRAPQVVGISILVLIVFAVILAVTG